MSEDVDIINKNDIIAIKQKIKDSININFYDYIKNKIIKNVKDCNFLYTQVCYLIKLFLLYEFEKNIDINYDLNEIFIRFCFKLLKSGNKEYILNETDGKDDIKKRLVMFYNSFNIDNTNIPFICPLDLDSNSHITNALSRDISVLCNIHTLNLSYCDNITDVSSLDSVHTLDLTKCKNITDVSALGNVHTLILP